MSPLTAFFCAVAVVALATALHPFTTYPLSLFVLRALGVRPRRPAAGAGGAVHGAAGGGGANPGSPRIAVLLCVHDEAEVIESRLRNLLAMTEARDDVAVLVYSDGSTDGTVEILNRFAGRITVVAAAERHGKTHGMNVLVTRTNAPIVVFTDAAVTMPADALERLGRHFDDPAVGCVCARIVAVPPGAGIDSDTARTSVGYWAFDAVVRRLESEVASVMGAHGPLFAIRRALHVPPPADLIDDFMVSMSILHGGHRVIQADDFVGFKAVAPRRGDEFARKARIACQSFNAHRAMAAERAAQPWLVQYLYASHKTLKWLTVVSLGVAVLAGTAALVSAGLWVWALGGWLAAFAVIVLGALGVRPFSLGFEALSALVGTGLGVWQSLNGRRYQTWTSPRSARQAA